MAGARLSPAGRQVAGARLSLAGRQVAGARLSLAGRPRCAGCAGGGSPGRLGPIRAGGALCLLRAAYGLALLCAPAGMIRLASGAQGSPPPGIPRARRGQPRAAAAPTQPAAAARARQPAPAAHTRPGRRACRVARVLGARHVVQATLSALARRADPASPVPLACGAAIDLAHALSMLGLAAADHRARRAALTDGAVEAGFTVTGVLVAWAGPGLGWAGDHRMTGH
jgi:hypothetical protein